MVFGSKQNVCCLAQVVVLWVGTNNYQHTAEQVAGGILTISELLSSRLPKAKIIVLVSHFTDVFLMNWLVSDRCSLWTFMSLLPFFVWLNLYEICRIFMSLC